MPPDAAVLSIEFKTKSVNTHAVSNNTNNAEILICILARLSCIRI